MSGEVGVVSLVAPPAVREPPVGEVGVGVSGSIQKTSIIVERPAGGLGPA